MLWLHGFTGGGQDLEPLWPLLPAAAHIAPDLVGHGPPPVPDNLSCYTMSACVSQVAAPLSPAPMPVIGYSMGARVALSLACAHPERVSALVLISGTAGLSDPDEAAARRAADEALADHIEAVGVAQFLEEWARVPIIASQANIAPQWRARMAARRAHLSARGLANSLRGMGTGAMPPLWDQLDKLPCPTLLLTGALDTKFCDLATRMAARIRDVRHVVIPDVGHTAHLEAPQAAAAQIAAFLAATGAATAS